MLATFIIIVGGVLPSLSVILIFCAREFPKIMPDEGLLIVRTAVSINASASASSTTVKVTVPLVLPAGIVITVFDNV